MSKRSAVLAEIDEMLDRLEPQPDDASLELLQQRLNELLKPFDDLYDPPWVAIHSISVSESGELIAVAEPLELQQDISQWCQHIADYLGNRFIIEPYENVDVRSLMAMVSQEPSRVLRELTETANDLSTYGLVSRSDMARMTSLCTPLGEAATDAGAALPAGQSRTKQKTPGSLDSPSAKTGPALDDE
jgi:hypothetical protein